MVTRKTKFSISIEKMQIEFEGSQELGQQIQHGVQQAIGGLMGVQARLLAMQQLSHCPHVRVDVIEELLVSRAEIVQPVLAVRCFYESVLRAFPVAGESHLVDRDIGHAADLDYLRKIRAAASLPTLVGSGVDPGNVSDILSIVDGVIVASSLKVDGLWWNPVDRERAKQFVARAGKAS